MSFAFKRPEDSPGFLLWQLTNQWQRQQRQALAKLGLTHGQFVVLAGLLWLSQNTKEQVTQNQVADLTKIDKMSMSDLVVALIEKKLINRVAHANDGRAYAITLTTKGKEKVLKAIPVVEEIDAKFFTTQTKELLHLHRVLNSRLSPLK